MAYQLKYPKYYPEQRGRKPAAVAWDFLSGNQDHAPEACVSWLTNEFERVGHVRMAKHAQNKTSKPKIERADWKGYANIDLSTEDKEAIRGGVLDGESVLDIIADILGEGHKIALTYDREKDTVTVAATGVYTYCRNAGYTLTCFGRTLTQVLTVLAYKHDVVAKRDWSRFVNTVRQVDDIG